MQSESIKVLSYNIHKGFSAGNLRFTLAQLRLALHELCPDIVCLQEVQGVHKRHQRYFPGDLEFSQLEYLAGDLWPHFAYGRNAIYTEGHHGNAILSRFPIESWENEALPSNRFEKRGLLHAKLRLGGPVLLNVFCSHFGLFEADRARQVKQVCSRVGQHVAPDEPIVLAGDFNDWRRRATLRLKNQIGLREAFLDQSGFHAKTFPAAFPLLPLDRMYYRGLDVKAAQAMANAKWAGLSDHVALFAEFQIKFNIE